MDDPFADPSLYRSVGTTPGVTSSRGDDPFADPSLYQSAPSEADKGPDTWHDYYNSAMTGVHSSIGATIAAMGQTSSSPAFRKWAEDAVEQERQANKEDIDEMSPAGQKAVSLSPFSKEFWGDHPLRNIGLQATQQAVPLLGMAGAAAVTGGMGGALAGGVGSAVGASLGAGAVSAVQTGGGAVSDIQDLIKNTPHEDLMKNKDYATLASVMSEDDAKAAFAQQRIDQSNLFGKTAIVGGIAGGLLPESSLGVKGLLGKMGVGAGVGFVAGAGQDLGTNLAIGQATGNIGDNDIGQLNLTKQEQYLYQHHLNNLTGPGGVTNSDGSRSTVLQTTVEVDGKTYNIPTVWDGKILSPRDALQRARQEGLSNFPSYDSEDQAEARYGQMHTYMERDISGTGNKPKDLLGSAIKAGAGFAAWGVLGGAHRRGDPTKARGSLDSEAKGGEFKSVGSDPNQLKEEAKNKVDKNIPDQPAGTGPAPPSSPIGDAEKAALAAAQPPPPKPPPTPGVNKSTEPVSEMRTEGEQMPPVHSPSVPDMSGQDPQIPPSGESQPPANVGPANAPSRGELPPTEAIPERPETLQLQHEALLNSQKEIVLYPGGKGVIDLPQGVKNIKQKELSNGDVIQYRTDGPNKLNIPKIIIAFKKGTLNDLLDLGSTSRAEAISRVAAGEKPAAVVERTPDNVEVRTAEGTTTTAPAQVQALEQTKLASENRITVEPTEKVGAERLAPIPVPVPPDKSVGGHFTKAQREQRVTNDNKANNIYEKYGKISDPHDALAIDPTQEGGKGARVRLLARVKAAIDEAKAEGIKIPKRIKEFQDASMSHPSATIWLAEARTLLSRANKDGTPAFQQFLVHDHMLRHGDIAGVLRDRINEAKEKLEPKHEVKEEVLGETTPEVTPHEVAEHAETDEEAAYQAAHEARTQKEEANRQATRRAESEALRQEWAGTGQREAPKFQVETKRAGLTRIKDQIQARKEKFEREGFPTIPQLKAGNYLKVHEEVEGHNISIETGEGETRGSYKAKSQGHYGYIRGTVGKDGDHIDAFINPDGKETGKIFVLNQLGKGGVFDEHKVFMGFTKKDDVIQTYVHSYDDPKAAGKRINGVVELTKDEFKKWLDEGDHSQPISEGHAGERPDKVLETHTMSGEAGQVKYLERAALKDTLGHVNLKNYSQSIRPMIRKLIDRLNNLVGDTPIYGLDTTEMDKLNDRGLGTLDGFYNATYNHIIVNAEIDEKELGETILHEAFHAATATTLRNNKHLADLAQRLYDEAKGATNSYFHRGDVEPKLTYGLTNPEEMLAEIHSNSAWAKWLKGQSISPGLAQDLDMPRWRRASLYQGALDWFRKMLGLSPREYSVVEAAFNIGERLMWAKEPVDEFGYRVRAAQVPRTELEGGPNLAMYRPKDYSKSINNISDRVAKGIDALQAGRSGAADLIRTQGKRFLPMLDMVHGNLKYFGAQTEDNPLLKLANHAISMDGERGVLKGKSDDLLHNVQVYTHRNPDEATGLVDLLQKSDFSNVHPDYELGKGLNSHVQVKPNPADSSLSSFEAIRDHPTLSKQYNELTPEGKQIFGGIRDMLRTIAEGNAKVARDSLTRAIKQELSGDMSRPDAAEIKAAYSKLLGGEDLTDEEEKAYAKDPIIQAYRQANQILDRNGFYYPAKRFGNHVVTGRHEYDVPSNAFRGPEDPNRIITGSRKEAFDFVNSLNLPSTTEKKYFHVGPNGEKQYTTKADVRMAAGRNVAPQEEYHTLVNPKHVEFAESSHEGRKIADALRDAGVKDVTNPVLREQNEHVDYSLHSGQVAAFNNALDSMGHVTPGVRDAAKEAINHVAVASMPGNRIAKNFLRKNRVAGADGDLLRTLDSYRGAAATFQAGAKYRPQIDEGLNTIRDIADKARLSNSEHDLDMSSVVKEMEHRLIGFKQGSYGELSKSSLHNIATLGLFKYLFSPAHFALHLMHPVITSIPEMSGEHGFWPVYREMTKSYNDMGGVLSTMMGGVKSAAAKAWDFDKRPTDFISGLKNELTKNGRDKATITMLEGLEHDGYLTHMGLDFSPFYRKAGGLTYMADRSLSIMQELNNSAESINRVGTATTAFNLARSKGMSDEEAAGYARKVLSQTHGMYANINRAPFMLDHPLVRSMMQFKTFPMMIYRILARNIYNIYKGDTPGVRWQAAKALTGMVGTAALFTGAQGATPEPVRLGITLTNMLGLTDSWEEEQDKIQRTLAAELSPEVASTVQHGLGHVLGWDLHHRFGINDLLVFGEPQTTNPQDVENWMTNAALGAPWGLGIDAYTGYQALLDGDYGKAVNMLMPKALVDLNKAYSLSTEGKLTSKGSVLVPDIGKMGLLGQALGFVPSAVTEAQQARVAYGAEQAEQRTAKEKVDALKNKHRHQQTTLGYKTSPRNLQELKERAHAYGIQ